MGIEVRGLTTPTGPGQLTMLPVLDDQGDALRQRREQRAKEQFGQEPLLLH